MTNDAREVLRFWRLVHLSARRVRDAERFGDEIELARALEDRDFYVSQLQRALQ